MFKIALAALALLVAAWTLVGFFLVPELARRELPKLVESQLQHHARIGAIEFNPFTLTLRATGFAIDDEAGQAVLGFESAAIDLEWHSLLRRAWVLSGVQLGGPFVHVVVDKEGRLNLAKLVQAGPAPGTDTAGAATLPRFDIEQIAIDKGRIDFEDRRGGYRNALGELSLHLKNLTSLDSERGDYALTARATTGAKISWTGTVSLNPLSTAGVLTLKDVALSELGPYLALASQARIASGLADVELPYQVELPGGEPRLTLAGAKLGIRDLALMTPAGLPVAKLGVLAVGGVDFSLRERRISAKSLLVADGQLAVARDANGELDVQKLFAAGGGETGKKVPVADAPVMARPAGTRKAPAPWQLAIAAIEVRNIAARYSDMSAKTPLLVTLDGLGARAGLSGQTGEGGDGVKWRVEGGAARVQRIDVGVVNAAADAKGAVTAASTSGISASELAATGMTFDSSSSALGIASLRVGSARVGASLRDGRLNLLDLMPALKSDPSSRPLAVSIAAIELADGSVALADIDQKLDVALDKITAKATGIASDRNKPLGFELAAQVRSGGRIAARGSLVPASGRLDTALQVSALALAPLQPLLSRYAAMRLTSGEAALNGTLKGTLGGDKAAKAKVTADADTGLVYSGTAALTNVALDDLQGARLAGWQSLSAASLRFGFVPARLDIDELRWVAPAGRFALEKDGTSNFSHLKPGATVEGGAGTTAPAPATATPVAATATPPVSPTSQQSAAADDAEPMALAVRRVVIAQGKLEFSDASIEPGFTAMITDLAGTANGLSSARDTRSQFSLEGRVGEFGFARLSGAVNVYAPRDRTTFRVELRNIDLATVSPYSMRFAGYRIAEGHATLDLNYRVRGALIEGDNRIVLDRLVLGERVESPRALNIPLALAIALLKEPDGSIKIELPVTGSLDDPQFSIAPLIWKAVGNFLGGIISAPFRMLGRLFGGADDEGAGTILFEPAASRLLPPEREKLIRLAGLLAKRPELKVTVPAHVDDSADPRALRRVALAREVALRAGFAVADDESAGQVNSDDRRTRAALRSLFTERFSAAELAKLVADAEAREKQGAKPGDEGAQSSDAAAKPLGLLDRARNLVAGEPQLADPRPLYNELTRRLRDSQPLAADALPNLGRARAAAIAEGLRSANVSAERMTLTPPVSAPGTATPAGATRAGDPDARYVKVEMSLSSR